MQLWACAALVCISSSTNPARIPKSVISFTPDVWRCGNQCRPDGLLLTTALQQYGPNQQQNNCSIITKDVTDSNTAAIKSKFSSSSYIERQRMQYAIKTPSTIFVQGPALEVCIGRVSTGVGLKVAGSWQQVVCLDGSFKRGRKQEERGNGKYESQKLTLTVTCHHAPALAPPLRSTHQQKSRSGGEALQLSVDVN